MKQNTLIVTILFLICNIGFIKAQCPAGQVELSLEIETDQYGYEIYWEIVPAGNNCGVSTIASGGNTNVGCSGGGLQTASAGSGYANNTNINEGPYCVTENSSFDLIYVDDYGDGGGEFELFINGLQIKSFEALTSANLTFPFEAKEPLAFDASIYNLSTPYLYEIEGTRIVEGILFNHGATTITSLDINYQIDNDPIQTSSLTGLNISNFEAYTFIHPISWVATEGLYTIKIWASNLNGNFDMDTSNDELALNIEVGLGRKNIIDQYLTIAPIITEIGNSSNGLDKPTDLDFHPVLNKKELWVINKRLEADGSSVSVFTNAGEANENQQTKVDGNAWHFMSMSTGIAFSNNGNFATSPGVFDANHDGGSPFTGPALWSSDLSVFAEPSGGNGSHLDMLHCSPKSQGIASEKENVFWLFDGYNNDIVRYDFVDDHGPGNSFHGDAIIHRYNDFQVAMDPNEKVPSHLVVSGDWVYVVDYGNQKVFRININSGTIGGIPAFGPFEGVVEYKYKTNYNWENVVTTGLLQPAGIDVIDDRMIVSDYETGEIIIYDISNLPATELHRINTTATGIMGVKIGPEGKIWYVDYDANKINMIDGEGLEWVEPVDTVSGINSIEELTFNIFPNPAKAYFNIVSNNLNNSKIDLKVFDFSGRTVFQSSSVNNPQLISTEGWSKGIYYVVIKIDNESIIKKVSITN